MLLSEHVYCVDIIFKMTEWIEQWICIKFSIKLEHSSMETTQMIQKAAAMGSWWLAVSPRTRAHWCIKSHAEFFGQKLTHPGDSAPLQLRFGVLWLLFFPKTKITFEKQQERFQTINEIQENMMGGLILIGRTVWGPKVPTSKGTEVSLICVPSFLYLVSSSINDSIFHITWLDTFWTDLIFVMDFIWDPTLPFRISSDFHLK